MMVTKCCVPQCKHHDNVIKKSNVVSFHAFPKEEKIRTQWLQNIKQPELQINNQSKVCSAHFKPEDYMFCQSAGMIILKPDAVPTSFAWTTEDTSDELNNRFIVFDDVKDDSMLVTDISTEDMMEDKSEQMFIMSCESDGGSDKDKDPENSGNERLKNILDRLTTTLTGDDETSTVSQDTTNFSDPTTDFSDPVSCQNSHSLVEQEDLHSEDNLFSESGKSSLLSSFPLSLVMNHPNFMLKMPLLSSSVDPLCLDVTHTVIDEVGILTDQSFTLSHPITGKNVTVSPAGKNIVKEFKNKLSESVKRANKWRKSSHVHSEKENIFKGVLDSMKKDLILQSLEDSDYLMENKNKFNNLDLCILPPGKIILGRTSKGVWLIGSQQSKYKSKISYSGDGDIGVGYYNNAHGSCRNIPNEHAKKTVHGSCRNISNEHPKTVHTVSMTTGNDKDIPKKEMDDGHQTETDIFSKEVTNSISKSVNNLCMTSKSRWNTESKLPLPRQESITMVTESPRPVMLIRSDGNSLQGIQVSGNQSELGNSDTFLPEGNNLSSDCEVKVKEEPVDTNYQSEVNQSTTVPADMSSSTVVKFPCLTQFGKKNNTPKLGQKRKIDDTDMTESSSKFILINPVNTDQNTSQSDDQDMTHSRTADDSDLSSELDDSETSRCGHDSSSGRFPVIEDDERGSLRGAESTRGTKRQTRWGVSTFREWLKERHLEPDFENLPADILDERLEKFYAELRTSDGKLYASNSFIGIRASINRHLTHEPHNRLISIFTDPAFYKSNKVFKAMLRKIRNEVVKKERPLPISTEDMTKLMTSNVLNINTPKGLQNKVWFDLTLNFTYKNCPKQRDYKSNMFLFRTDEDGIEYVELDDPNRSPEVISPRMYATRDIYCPVVSLMKYLTKRNNASDDFFQQPRCQRSKTEDNWYTSRPMGGRQLGKMMENISKEAGLSRVYTNVGLKEVITKSVYVPPNTIGMIPNK